MGTLNLGILAHVDAGKTSLTERLLYAAGVIDEIGRVDDGNTQTDSLALERQRGITIKSAVVSFAIDDITVNLIDTPGHPDFIAEVERVLSVLDGAVLVISAVEGVQPQTRVLLRTLRRLRIPTLIFVNKLDRAGADDDRVLRGIAEKLTSGIVAMGSAFGLGTRRAGFAPHGADDAAFVSRLADVVADHDDAVLAAYLDGGVPYRRLRAELAAQTGRGLVHPVYFGSAVTGAGVEALTAGIWELLPTEGGDPRGPVSGTVFKVERGTAGEKIAYVRMFSGTVRVRDRLALGGDREGKVTAVRVFESGAAVHRDQVGAGQIGQLWGVADIQIGDPIAVPDAAGASGAAGRPGEARGAAGRPGEARGAAGGPGEAWGAVPERHYFAPPSLETVVVPRRPADRGALHAALAQLAEQDPLINLRQDPVRQEISVSLYGEVQKEVIAATLAGEYGLEVSFRETTTICIERPVGAGAAMEVINTGPNPFLATVGLRIEPAAVDTGVGFRLGIERGSLPPAFLKAIEETVYETLQQGLHGWRVTDCVVTLTHSGYWARQSHAHGTFDKSMSSTAGDFRNLTPLVLMEALRQAGTTVYEPMHRFQIELPAELVGSLLPVLARLRAVPQPPAMRGASCLLDGEIPAAQVHQLQQQLPALTRGEGVLESGFNRYQPARGAIPKRPRADHNPLHRREYLLHVVRRV